MARGATRRNLAGLAMRAHAIATWRHLQAMALAGPAAALLRWAAVGVALAALGLAVFGPTPGSVSGGVVPDADWRLPDLTSLALDAADARRGDTRLWSSQPTETPASDAGSALPPRFVAVFRTPSSAEAVFLSAQGQRRRAAVGAALDGGFVVEAIYSTRVRLRADDGRLVDQRLLDAPVPSE